MKFAKKFVDKFENETNAFVDLHGIIRISPGARIFRSTICGPLYLSRNTQLGPDVVAGKYTGMNESCFIARGTIGAYCAIGARSSFNPFNHPTSWLSIHEFQYHAKAYDWIEEYRNFDRLERTADMFEAVSVGNDVWTGHHVNVMGGVRVGDGAIIAAGSVVTKDVPPYAVVAGVPAVVKRLRFPDATIERLMRVKWWELDLSDLSGLPFRDIDRCLDLIEEIRAKKPTQMEAEGQAANA
jgi:acetyltransferase-like isoleucine patch superfamily enzyme